MPSDFYLRQNRDIFETIYSMFTYARPIDGITVCEEMRKNGTYDENTTRSYLAQLMEITPTSANVMEYVAIVHDKALLRGVAQAAAEITAMVQEGVGEPSDILEAAEQKMYAVRRGQSAQDMVPLRQVLPDVLDRLGEMSESENHLPGLSTGLSAVDQKITGLNKSDLILLAARPGMGKTSFALNIALNVAKSTHKTVAVFSLEMSREQLATRLLSSEACVENYRLKTGSLRETDWEKIAGAATHPQQGGHPDRRQPHALRGGYERQVPPSGQSGTGGHRLSAADDLRRRQPGRRREPPAGGLRYVPNAQNYGQRTQYPGHLPEPAVPCQREAGR